MLRRASLLPILALALFVSCQSEASRLKELRRHFEITSFDQLPVDRGLHADHYPASNEMRIDLFEPHIRDLRGGYVGVGTDQNLTFIAWARSDFAWLMDFDYVAVDVNRIHLHFITISPDYASFAKLWERGNRRSSQELLRKHFGEGTEWKRISYAFRIAHRGHHDVPNRLRDLAQMEKRFGLKTFSNRKADYDYVRRMAIEGRIQAVPGDLLGSVTMRQIAAAAGKMELPIRLVYTSNAEEYFRYPVAMRQNFLSLPSDERSVLMRTATSGSKNVLGYPEGEKFPDDYPFHYNMQPMSVLHAWMRWPTRFRMLDMIRHNSKLADGLSRQEKTPAQLGLEARNDIDLSPLGERPGRSAYYDTKRFLPHDSQI